MPDISATAAAVIVVLPILVVAAIEAAARWEDRKHDYSHHSRSARFDRAANALKGFGRNA